jgi:hypothetical protein
LQIRALSAKAFFSYLQTDPARRRDERAAPGSPDRARLEASHCCFPEENNPRRKHMLVTPKPLQAQAGDWWDIPARELPRRCWLYGNHYLAGALSLTVAPPGLGKSTLAICEAVAMAAGRDLLGVPIGKGERWPWRKRLNVLYWNGEETLDEIRRRVFAVCQHFGIRPRTLRDLNIASGLDEPLIVASKGENGEITYDTKRLRQRMSDLLIDVLMVDPFIATHRLNENDNMAIEAVARSWARTASITGASVELIHHARKGSHETTAGDARGASALVAAARSVRVLNAMTDAEATRAGIKNARGIFRVELGKTNYAPAGGPSWYQIAPVDLPNGDSVGVAKPWRCPGPFEGIEPSHREAVLVKLQEGNYRADTRSDDWVGKVVAEVTGLDPENDKLRLKGIVAGWLADGTLTEIEKKDATRQKRIYIKPGGAPVRK